jgi:hypothetical protein
MELKLKSRRVRPIEELWAMEDNSPAVCGPSPAAYAARHGLRLSRTYLEFLRRQRADTNGAPRAPRMRRRTVAA